MKRKIISIICFFVVFFCMQFVVGTFLLKGDTDSMSRIVTHEMRKTEHIDTLFLGDSQIRRSLNIPLFDELTGNENFSMATSSQNIDGSYALLQECYKYHPEIKDVYVCLNYCGNYQGDFWDRSNLKNTYAISDYLTDSKIKFDYLIHASSPKYYLNHSLRIGKNRTSGNPKNIIKTLKHRLNGTYKNFIYTDTAQDDYVGKGCFVSKKSLSKPLIKKDDELNVFNESEVSSDYTNTILKICDFCKKNNLRIMFITIPVEKYNLYSVINYDGYNKLVSDLLESLNIKYYNFNLVRNEFLSFDYTDFYDAEHLDYEGSLKFTKLFYEFIKADEESRNKYLYTSFDEMQHSSPNGIFGMMYNLSDDGKIFNFTPLTNISEVSKITYDYYIKTKENFEPLVLGTNNPCVVLPENSKGKIQIDVKYGEEKTAFTVDFNTLWIK